MLRDLVQLNKILEPGASFSIPKTLRGMVVCEHFHSNKVEGNNHTGS